VKQRVYFLRWGMTTDMSFTSRSTGSFPLAAAAFEYEEWPFVPCEGPSSRRRFLEDGSDEDGAARLATWREIWLNSSM
jgi:hypothetical protein